jgi:hypothetical protein
MKRKKDIFCSVGDPEPDPHVFGPPGTGFTSQRSGSGSFPFLIMCEIMPEKNILTPNFIRGSESAPKSHGSPTLIFWHFNSLVRLQSTKATRLNHLFSDFELLEEDLRME